MSLQKSDPQVASLIHSEEERQRNKLSLIPSENFFSTAVREAAGSVFAHKYSEGNVGRRYYEGSDVVDELEILTIERARQLFKLPEDWSVNVQALSGSNANLATYLALLEDGDTILGMYLPDGGHLSHGWSYDPSDSGDKGQLVYTGGARKVHITSRLFHTVQYKTDPKTQQLNYEAVARIAREHRPKLIVAGGTAYPRLIDWDQLRLIADEVGAYLMADIAHEAGLVAAEVIPSPVGIADVVTMTTHKTLRSGRGALILAPERLVNKINRGVLPGLQGGPFNHNIASVCVGLGEALQKTFRQHAEQMLRNTAALAEALRNRSFSLVTGGGDKHLLLVDLRSEPLFGKKYARALDIAGLVMNFNTMPQETRSPADPSAVRLGTPWVTTRGMEESEMRQIAEWMRQVMTVAGKWAELGFDEFEREARQSKELAVVAEQVAMLCQRYPLLVHEGVEARVET